MSSQDYEARPEPTGTAPADDASGDRDDAAGAGADGSPLFPGDNGGPAPAPGDGDQPDSPPGADADEVSVVRAERDEYLDTLRRVQADFENYKKRVLRQQTEHLERAAESLVTKMLGVLDTLDLALAHMGAGHDGLAQVGSALWDVLGKEGLEKLDPLGSAFDPNEAEAVMHEPADEGQGGPEVVEVLRPGYRWRGRVIRPAMVKVKG
ncbi:MAG TPA: nucleotide exchange factor GrpE [Acidimicrobiales bacterium]|nr:nucleotide exchange factor GrpE [Acidimicrobiales bacterium]